MLKHEVAELAWKECKPGVTEDFHNHRVVKLPKFVILMPRLDHWPRPSRSLDRVPFIEIIAYPKPEHFENFRRSSGSVEDNAPGERFPEAMGSVKLHFSPGQQRPSLTHVQGHFIPRMNGSVSRKLAKFYGGWRVHLLKETISAVHDKGLELSFYASALNPWHRHLFFSPSAHDLNQAVKKLGAKISQVSEGKFLIHKD